jgi:hypothetical protein
MPGANSPTLIVARFLKSNNYHATLETFLAEAGLDPEAGTTSTTEWTLEQIIEEKAQFDASLTFEKTSKDVEQGWHLPAPSQANILSQPNSSNVLCVAVDRFTNRILSTHADKSLYFYKGLPPYPHHSSYTNDDSPILFISRLFNKGDFILTTAMSGQLGLRVAANGTSLFSRRDHLKMAVSVGSCGLHSSIIIATAGWDQKIHFYMTSPNSHHDLREDPEVDQGVFFMEPFHTVSLPTVPESILFVKHPDTGNNFLIISRRDSSFLYYYEIVPDEVTTALDSDGRVTPAILYRGRQNLAPNSTAWVSFTPSCLRSHPSDPTFLAIATSHLPHMKLIVVRLLFPVQSNYASTSATTINPAASLITSDSIQTLVPTNPRLTLSDTPNHAAIAARADLALQDRESAAITCFVTTMAPQTPYSTPQLAWRPSGTGVWVNGDDGVIRGIEVPSGKVVAILKDGGNGKGHEAGSKVRCLWAGTMRDGEKAGEGSEREVLVSGGFDRRVIVWECEDTSRDM